MKKNVHVAVGVIVNSQSEICIALRQEGKHLAGYWEFPGGKVEAHESVQEALVRELHEELAIDVLSSSPLTVIHFDYPGKTVCLDVHWVKEFGGEAQGNEKQKIKWVLPEDLSNYQFPEANVEIINAIHNVY